MTSWKKFIPRENDGVPFLFRGNPRDNRSGPRGARNTTRGLTHSLDVGKEGLAMKATRNVVLPEHAWERILRDRIVTESGCWEWSGYRDRDGYGFVSLAANYLRVHRVSAALHLGLDLARSDLFVCHRCDNPPCFNPEHLFIGTPTDNNRDMHAKGRDGRDKRRIYPTHKACAICGTEFEPHPSHRSRVLTCSIRCASASKSAKKRGKGYRVTPEMCVEIKRLLAQGVAGKDIAERFGVSRCTVSHIKTGKREIVQ